MGDYMTDWAMYGYSIIVVEFLLINHPCQTKDFEVLRKYFCPEPLKPYAMHQLYLYIS